MVGEPVPATELQGSVNNLVSGFPSSVQTVQQLAGRIQQLIIWGLPVDFYATYRERLAAVTPEEVRTAATTRLTPNNLETKFDKKTVRSSERPARFEPAFLFARRDFDSLQ